MRKSLYEILAEIFVGCMLSAGAIGSVALAIKSIIYLIETVGVIW